MAVSKRLLRSGRHFFAGSAILRLFDASPEARSMEESPGRAAEEPATVEAGDVQPSPNAVQRRPRASFIAADRDHGADGVDAVAGSEFVDDRIRLRE